MNQGDVLALMAFEGGLGGDLTGSAITASAPVQVIGGNYCTPMPSDTCCCDHLEESMFPLETLGDEYFATSPAVPSMPEGKPRRIRVVATEDGTVLTFSPPQQGVSTQLSAGQFVDIDGIAQDLHIKANHKVLVSQIMYGQNAGGNTGDPAMELVAPAGQYRDRYLFHAPPDYEVNYVNVVAPAGAQIVLDRQPVLGFHDIADTGFQSVRVQLFSDTGTHIISGNAGFGISVYGYGQFTSYWYSGGLDLKPIAIE